MTLTHAILWFWATLMPLLRLLTAGLLMSLFGFVPPRPSDRILGTWQSIAGDLRVTITEHDGQYAGRLVWFRCLPGDKPMEAHFDTENPSPALRNRPWLGLPIVQMLRYQGTNEWGGGTVYDPNTGRTYSAVVRLTGEEQLTVRGYWKVQWLGKNLAFRRVL
jgi:uncharacterized protein (DUF2147 family)